MKLIERLLNETSIPCLGLTDLNQLTIELDSEVAEGVRRVTLAHEVVHAVVGILGPNTIFESSEVEEKFVSVFAPLMLAALRDNPDLVRYLMAS